MTFLALIAIIFCGFAVYNLTCAFVDIPTKKTSQMMMLSRKQQGTKNEKLLDVYVTKIAGWIAPYLRLDRLKRNKVQRAGHCRSAAYPGGLYSQSLGNCRGSWPVCHPHGTSYSAAGAYFDRSCSGAVVFNLLCSL